MLFEMIVNDGIISADVIRGMTVLEWTSSDRQNYESARISFGNNKQKPNFDSEVRRGDKWSMALKPRKIWEYRNEFKSFNNESIEKVLRGFETGIFENNFSEKPHGDMIPKYETSLDYFS